MKRAIITGLGAYIPDYVLNNKKLENDLDTSEQWIISRTGIKERRILKDKDKATSYICIKAANDLIEKTGTDPLSIELVIVSTSTPDMHLAATSCHVATQIKAYNAFSFDMNAACSGFLYALSIAAKFIESARYKKVLVLGADKMSSVINYKDRKTSVIFGDGGGCALVEGSDGVNQGIIDELMRGDGTGRYLLNIKGGGSLYPYNSVEDKNMFYLNQNGKVVFKKAVHSMADVSNELMKKNKLSKDDIDWVVMHQANIRIINKVSEELGFDKSKVLINIDKYGNTTNGTIPLVLWEFNKKFKKEDNLLLISFGGGFTWGAMYLKWAY